MSAPRTGMVGVGMMGIPMARHLLRAGLPVTVFDISSVNLEQAEALGAVRASSPRGVAEASDVTLVIVPDDEDVRAVCFGDDGLVAGAGEGSVIVLCSSVTPATCVEVADHATTRGVQVLDAPLTGGPRRAESADLTLLVGGPEAALEKAQPVFDAFSGAVRHLGDIGSGQVGKTVNNVIHWGEVVVITEALALGAALGVDASKLRPALMDASVDSRSLRELDQMKLTWPEKDLVNALRMAEDVGQELDVAQLVRAKMQGIDQQRVVRLLSDEGW